MKKIIVFVICLLIIAPSAYGVDFYGSKISNLSSSNEEQSKYDTLTASNNPLEESQRGCCSWHGGVCGCDEKTGRVICCDGTLSPSCRCW